MKKLCGIVIGVGSVGKLHALALDKICENIILIDPNTEVESWSKDNLQSKITYYKSTKELKNAVTDKFSYVAVIANLGPSHYKTFCYLTELGIKKIVCEKPLASSLHHIRKIKKLANKHNIRLIVGITRRYSNYAKNLKSIFREFCGEEILFIEVLAGAQCMVTSGLHWLDLAFELFEESPNEVQAKVHIDKINPRSSELGYWDGYASWKFGGKRRLSMSYSNQSHAKAKIHLYGKYGYLEVDPSTDIKVYAIDKSEIGEISKITDTKVCKYIKTIPIGDIQDHDPFYNQLKILLSDVEIPYRLEDAENVMNSLVGSLVSSQKNRSVSLPVKSSSFYFVKNWNIS